MFYIYRKKEFVLGQGYVPQPPQVLTQEEFDELTNYGRDIYQNQWFTPCKEKPDLFQEDHQR